MPLEVLPHPRSLAVRAAFLIAGILANGVATGVYIGARLGPGPRDGLMTGLAGKGVSIRRARTCIELSVLTIGWLLAGTVGVGTVLYAVSIGPLAHYLIPRLTVSTGGSVDGSGGLGRLTARAGPQRSLPVARCHEAECR